MSTWDRSQQNPNQGPGYAELFETVQMLIGVVADQEVRLHRLENRPYDDSIKRLAEGSLRAAAVDDGAVVDAFAGGRLRLTEGDRHD